MTTRNKAITLRNLPSEVARLVREKARAEGISLNQAVIGVLEAYLGGRGRTETVHHDLDELAGAWTAAEAAAFEQALAEQRRLDPELWR